MYSSVMATVPIVHATGGLKDNRDRATLAGAPRREERLLDFAFQPFTMPRTSPEAVLLRLAPLLE
jgi:hypothetical protein